MDGTMGAQSWYIPLLVISTIVATAVSLLWVVHVWKKKDNE
jgi:magnesium transporter